MAERPVHGPPYATVLIRGILSDAAWPQFNGWAASRGIDVLSTGAGTCLDLIETWREETVIDQDHEGREYYRKEMVKLGRLIENLSDPTKQEELANTPPHLLNR